MRWDYHIGELFAKAGLTRWPLFGCSVIAIAIILERGWYYLRLRFNYAQFSRQLFIYLRSRQLSKGIDYCQEHSRNPIPQIAGTYLRNLKNAQRNSILTREGSNLLERVEARLRGLATITHVAPLLGLLGTVTGLVDAFHQIELAAGQVQAQSLAGGIWEALLSTVFGLIVAIPCMIAYHTYESYADRIARRMQSVVTELDEFFGNQSGQDFRHSLDDDIDFKNVAE